MTEAPRRPRVKSGRLSIFITAESIIVAGLLVWAQYWIDVYTRYSSYTPPDPVWHVGLVVLVIFIAVFLSLWSVALALLSFNKTSHNVLPRISVSTAVTSFISMLIVIILSLIGLISASASDQIWHASPIVTFFDPYKYIIRNITLAGIPVLFLLILIFSSQWLAHKLFES